MKNVSGEMPRVLRLFKAEAMWIHKCPVEHEVIHVGKGEPCNWCGEEEKEG